jgi:hypothetical protein
VRAQILPPTLRANITLSEGFVYVRNATLATTTRWCVSTFGPDESSAGQCEITDLVPDRKIQVSFAVSMANGCRYCTMHQVVGLRRLGGRRRVPYDLDAERATLGGVMLDNALIDAIRSDLTRGD